MTGREQHVWSAAFTRSMGKVREAARQADKTVLELRALNPDDTAFSGPEHDAARNCGGLTYGEFRAWYLVALKIAKHGFVTAAEINDAAYRQAFETYRRGSADFY
ncbi:hypothetical protein SAMN04487939_12029 [Lysobacter sp. yr284]|uniref:hypothetical protein n=1 Tax=Lysobacter sp. yr284 TaxID=1761791 RepID=UPI000894CAB5|nr:hypothetical protein [Lysobacter sp. yr284]SDZ17616.1 hypothetical protein SAMN04487939_12029 [Lysobacter sp. yr284]